MTKSQTVALPSHSTSTTAALIGLMLLAAPGFTQTAPVSSNKDSELCPSVCAQEKTIRPFHIAVPETKLADLRRRILATRWPDRETVPDPSQGVELSKVQELIHYWGADYDWRKIEAKLNALPQFVTKIDGLDIHFIHVRSKNPHALPIILTHGWPGSILEFVKCVSLLSDPASHGGREEDAFDVVVPSIPGYGLSAKPEETGWGPDRIGRAWDVLMKRLGYTRYVAEGGDHGSVISTVMARQAPPGSLGIHLTMPATVPPDAAKALSSGDQAPAGLSATEKAAHLKSVASEGSPAATLQSVRLHMPQTMSARAEIDPSVRRSSGSPITTVSCSCSQVMRLR